MQLTKHLRKIAVMLVAVILLPGFAIKPHYGGEITIRLNEPEDFSYTPSSYSNLIFYSLIYENFFYLEPDGDIYSNIFKEYRYDAKNRRLILVLADHLSFSNGKTVTPENVKLSLTLFLEMNLASSRKLGRMIRGIRIFSSTGTAQNPDNLQGNLQGKGLILDLSYDSPGIVSALTAPELVLTSGGEQVFSGPFFPAEWVKNQYMVLNPNPYYPGGRCYLDSVKVVFYDFYYPDVFLSEPGMTDQGFRELNAGIFHNMYLAFPQGKVGDNTRIALFSLLKKFYKDQNLVDLNSLTTNEESPVALNIRTFSDSRMRKILRYSNIKLFVLSSLKKIEEPISEFLRKKRVRIETIFIGDNQLNNFLNNNSIKFLLVSKTFNRRVPIEEKIKIILKEMSFGRYNEEYLKMIKQLDEIKNLKNRELLMEQVARIIEKVINDRFILPLYQKRFSLYIKNSLRGVELDYYGKPLFQKTRVK